MSRRHRPHRTAKVPNRRIADLEAEITRLTRELADTRALLEEIARGGTEAFMARRLAELEEGRQVARGQALEAALARSRAESELRALRDSISKASGFFGWLRRRVQKRRLSHERH